MSLYWKELEIIPGMLLEVDMFHHEAFSSSGHPVVLKWKILAFYSRKSDEAYLEYSTGKKFSLERVMKKKKLQAKLDRAELLQIPACTDFMVVQVYHDKIEAYKRCYNLDTLATVRDVRVVGS